MDFAACVKYALYPEQILQITVVGSAHRLPFFFHHSSRLVQRAFGVSLERKESFSAVFEIWLPRQSFLCLQEVKVIHPDP